MYDELLNFLYCPGCGAKFTDRVAYASHSESCDKYAEYVAKVEADYSFGHPDDPWRGD